MGDLLGKVQLSDAKAVVLDRILPFRKLELAKTSCWWAALVFADAYTTHSVKSVCDLFENGLPKRIWRPLTQLSYSFLVPNPSAVWRLSTALACVDPSGRRNTGPGSILHQHDECSRSSHTTAAFSWRNRSLETVQAKMKKKKNPWPGNASATSTVNMKQNEARMRKFSGTEVSPYQSTHETPLEMNTAEFCVFFFLAHDGRHASKFARKLAQGSV